MKDWAAIQLQNIHKFHSKNAHAWVNETDDKKVYSNTYFAIIDSIIAVSEIDNETVIAAMLAKINQDNSFMGDVIEKYYIPA